MLFTPKRTIQFEPDISKNKFTYTRVLTVQKLSFPVIFEKASVLSKGGGDTNIQALHSGRQSDSKENWGTDLDFENMRGYGDEQVIKLVKTTESATFRPSATVATSTDLQWSKEKRNNMSHP